MALKTDLGSGVRVTLSGVAGAMAIKRIVYAPHDPNMYKRDMSGEHVFKVILVGNSGVGKSSLAVRYTRGQYDDNIKSTIGVEFATIDYDVTYESVTKRVTLQLWDTAGQERFRAITSAYYRGARGVVLMYDITLATSFDSVETWRKEAEEFRTEVPYMYALVGNKSDLATRRVVATDVWKAYAATHNMLAFETSAKNNTAVDTVFEVMMRTLSAPLFRVGAGSDIAKSALAAARPLDLRDPAATAGPRARAPPPPSKCVC